MSGSDRYVHIVVVSWIPNAVARKKLIARLQIYGNVTSFVFRHCRLVLLFIITNGIQEKATNDRTLSRVDANNLLNTDWRALNSGWSICIGEFRIERRHIAALTWDAMFRSRRAPLQGGYLTRWLYGVQQAYSQIYYGKVLSAIFQLSNLVG